MKALGHLLLILVNLVMLPACEVVEPCPEGQGRSNAGLCLPFAAAADDASADDDDDASADDDDDSSADDDDDDDSAGPRPDGVDADGDGFVDGADGGSDCDDSDPAISPAAIERCDGLDNDCNGSVDDEAIDAALWHLDSDSDGYGGQLLSEEACQAPDSYVGNADDCNDLDGAVYPGATELCNGADDDCDGELDEDAPAASTWYLDNDGDGVGGLWLTQDACDMPAGYGPDPSDCDDSNGAIYPGAPELCDGADNDCDGSLGGDELDDDGDGLSECELDCDDANPLRFAGSGELCDGIDNDCDPATAALGGEVDADGDLVLSCLDCDDDPASGLLVFPGATEVCNSVDDDCDGSIDVGASDESTWYFDADGDGFGGFLLTQVACAAPTGYVASSNDCVELDPNSYPGAIEVCDGVDNDCNGQVDDGAAAVGSSWFADADADGYGDPGTVLTACSQPAGFVLNSLDCDDGNSAAHPGTYEVCDGVDNDCDGAVDEAGALNTTLWYIDADGDGYGRLSAPLSTCSQPTGYADNAADCDDEDAANDPGNVELCDGQDNDCNGLADFDASAEVDLDGDGSPGCADCDDGDPANAPGAAELCDGEDNDCTGFADMDAGGEADDDGDGSLSCEDCDDSDPENVPGGIEQCDGADNDCSGGPDMDAGGEADSDGDGSLSCEDCDDDPATGSDRYPGNPEVCDDSIDQDCDGVDAPCFSGVTFTDCGASGRMGPSQTQCDSAYSNTALAAAVTLSNEGYQQWVVPATAAYRIAAFGAQGGSMSSSLQGGQGASIRGDFNLQQGDVLSVLVGQVGTPAGDGAGGGGGSFVLVGSTVNATNILVIAGGGGGANSYSDFSGQDGRDGANGGDSNVTGPHCNSPALGGSGGGGGNGGCAAGGGGYSGVGAAGSHQAEGGQSFIAGGAGGDSSNSSGPPYGGYGGGGAGSPGNGYGGGGGGYSGGAGGTWDGNLAGNGGGGGSMNNGSNQLSLSGGNTGAGRVVITLAN